MKKLMVCCLLTLFLMSSCKKDAPYKDWVSKSFDITSVNTGNTYVINVSYPGSEFPTTAVPVIYLLDGFWYMDEMKAIQSDLTDEGVIPNCLLVSLDYKSGNGPWERAKDLTYPQWRDTTSGGGMKFHDFMNNELIPRIESEYLCDTANRTLVGHSLGGYFALFSVFKYAGLESLKFKNFIAASSTIMWGDNNSMFTYEQETSARVSDLPITLYIATGSLEGPETNVLIEEFYNIIQNRGYHSLRTTFERFPKSHGSNVAPAFTNGLKYIFQ